MPRKHEARRFGSCSADPSDVAKLTTLTCSSGTTSILITLVNPDMAPLAFYSFDHSSNSRININIIYFNLFVIYFTTIYILSVA